MEDNEEGAAMDAADTDVDAESDGAEAIDDRDGAPGGTDEMLPAVIILVVEALVLGCVELPANDVDILAMLSTPDLTVVAIVVPWIDGAVDVAVDSIVAAVMGLDMMFRVSADEVTVFIVIVVVLLEAVACTFCCCC